MLLGKEQAHSSTLSLLKRLYIRLLGFPAIGLQMRGRRILPAVKREVEALRKQPDSRLNICDAGCGRGALSFAFAERFAKDNVTGLEYEQDLVQHCIRLKETRHQENLTFKQWDITKPLEGGPWDVVVNVDTLEHVEEHASAAKNLYEALTPGGTLICHVPSLYSRMFGTQRVNIDVPGHVRPGYRGEELVDLLTSVGFEIEYWTTTYGSLETLCQRLSFWITGAAMKRASLYAFVYPFLLLLAIIGGFLPLGHKGTNILVVAKRAP